MKQELLYPNLSYKICGLCFKIHNALGRFRSEKSYADALEELFKRENISHTRAASLPPSFVGEGTRRNIVDLIIEDSVILEIKAKRIVTKEDYFQTKRYLAASGKKLGIVVNFHQKYLSPKRVLYS